MNIRSWIFGGGVLLLSACLPASELDPAAVSDSEVHTLSVPESGASAAEYTARAATLRLFGVQALGTPGAFATLADTATWATRDYRVGDAVGRNFLVADIGADGISLSGSSNLRLSVGADVPVRLIEHQFDLAAQQKGNHVYATDPAALSRIRQRYGVGADASALTIGDQDMIKLGQVAPGSVFFRLGFQEADRIYTVDGQTATVADVQVIADRVTKSCPSLHLTVGRGASIWDAVYAGR